jgi:uncharacterized protein YjiK
MNETRTQSATQFILRLAVAMGMSVPGSVAVAQDHPSEVAACEVRARLFGVQILGQEKVIEIDTVSGAGSAVSGEGLNAFVSHLALDIETMTLYGVILNGNELVTIDPTTGVLNMLGPLTTGRISGLAFDASSGQLIAVDYGSQSLFSIDPSTRIVTEISSLQGESICSLSPDPKNGLIYGSSCDFHDLLMTIDLNSSDQSVVGSFGATVVEKLAFDPIDEILYGTDTWSTQLFAIDPATADVTLHARMDLPIHALGLTFDPNARMLFAAGFFRQELLKIDPRTGSTTTVGALGFRGMTSLAYDCHTRTLYGEGERVLVTIDQERGEGTTTVPLGFPGIRGFAFDSSSGSIYGSDTNRDVLVSIDPQTGNATPIGRMGGQNVAALAFDQTTSTLYGADGRNLLTINTATGKATRVGGVDLGFIAGLAFDPAERVLFGVGDNRLWRIDPTSGSVTLMGDLGVSNVRSLAFDNATDTLYGIDAFDGKNLVINQLTGQATTIGSLPGFATIDGATFDPSTGTLFGASITDGRLVSIDPIAGTGEGVGWYAFSSSGMTYNPKDRHIYALRDRDLVKICPRSGIGVTVGSTGVYFGIGGLAFDTSGTSLYGTRGGGLYSINLSTGEATRVGAGPTSFSTTGLSFDPISGQLYAVTGDSLVTFDITTGASTRVGEIGFSNIRGLAFTSNDCNGNDVDDACDIASAFSYDGDGDGIPDECDPSAFDADVAGDSTTDLLDHARMTVCLTGPVGQLPFDCTLADLDLDFNVDLRDWSLFQNALTSR